MLPSFSQSPDWLSSEPLMFDDVQSLMDYLPTPPQSPPLKAGQAAGKPLSREEQLSYVSDLLLEDQDLHLLGWSCDFFDPAERDAGDSCLPCSPLDEVTEDSLWQCLSERGLEEKLVSSVLGSSPLLSDIDTSIFEDIVGSTLDCQNLIGAQEQSEATSDYGSAGGETSTSSSSDSGEWERCLPTFGLSSSDFNPPCYQMIY